MSIFDQMKNKAQSAARSAVQSTVRSAAANLGSRRETFTFAALPESVVQMQALPETAMDTPFQTAALAVCALCAFAADQNTGEVPACDEISYESYQNGGVLILVVAYSFGMTRVRDYSVYHYDAERDRALGQDELPGLLGVSAEALHSAVLRAAAQKFDEDYHTMEVWDTPSAFYQCRAETLGDYYLGDALVYLGEGEQPRVLLTTWSDLGAGVAFRDLPLELSPGKSGKLEDSLLDVSWDNTGVTIRFHGNEDSRAFWEERFQCGWDLEYDRSLPVAGLYSRYTDAVIHMARANDPPVLFLLTDQGRVEYVDLVSCIQGGYFCGGGPLIGVEHATGFIGPDETGPGRGGSYAYAACKDGSKVDLAEALAESRRAVPVSLTGTWQTTVTLQGFEGPCERAYVLDLDTGGWAEVKDTPLDMDDIDLYYSGTFTLLGETTDGMVYYYDLEPGGDGCDGVPYQGVLGLRATYDQDAWEEVLDATTLGVSLMSLFDDTPGTVTRLNRGGEAGSGILRRFALVESGYDGSILLEEADPNAESFVLG